MRSHIHSSPILLCYLLAADHSFPPLSSCSWTCKPPVTSITTVNANNQNDIFDRAISSWAIQVFYHPILLNPQDRHVFKSTHASHMAYMSRAFNFLKCNLVGAISCTNNEWPDIVDCLLASRYDVVGSKQGTTYAKAAHTTPYLRTTHGRLNCYARKANAAWCFIAQSFSTVYTNT
jgi:hypothetical protein